MMRFWPGVVLALLCAATPAQAALTLCNRTSYVLYTATAAVKGSQAQVQGWTRIAPGDCQVARSENLTADTYMVHARSSRAHGGPARAWGGKTAICVRDADFRTTQPIAPAMCKDDGTFALPFAPVAKGDHGNWTMTLDEAPALPSLTAAQLAGVKRLLRDNGYDVGPLDGMPDKKTGVALTAFRKRFHAEKADNAHLFAILESEALKTNAPAGYTICNDSKVLLQAALAQTDKNTIAVRGWWPVPPGACARAVTTPLAKSSYYLFARRKDGVPVLGGSEKFCIAPTAFEIRERGNCPAHAQTEAGFVLTQTNGVTGYVAHIGDKGLLPGGGAPAKPQATISK